MELDDGVLRKGFRASHQAPGWAYDLAGRVVDRFLPEHTDRLPEIVFVPKPEGRKFGGRHYPKQQLIAVYVSEDFPLVRAVILHEMVHWILTRQGDARGLHDESFYALVERVYRSFRVDRKTARYVEQICSDPQSLCAHW